MNKPNNREGFVNNAEPLPETPGPVIDNEPEQLEQPQEKWPVKVKLLHRGVRNGPDTVHELSVPRADRRRHQPLWQPVPRQSGWRRDHPRTQDDDDDVGAVRHPAAVHRSDGPARLEFLCL